MYIHGLRGNLLEALLSSCVWWSFRDLELKLGQGKVCSPQKKVNFTLTEEFLSAKCPFYGDKETGGNQSFRHFMMRFRGEIPPV